MQTTYCLQLYGNGPFPRFIEGYTSAAQARTIASQSLSEGYHLAEIVATRPVKHGYVVRELIETLEG